MAFGKLKKWLEGAAAQVNPFDNGKTFDTVTNNQQPGYRQAIPADVQQKIRNAKYGPLANNPTAQTNFLNANKPTYFNAAAYAPKAALNTLKDVGVEGIGKPLIRSSMALNQGIGNLELKLAGRPTQNAQQYAAGTGIPGLQKFTGYTGTKRQIIGDAATNALNFGVPATGEAIAKPVASVLPKSTPALIPKTIGTAGAGALLGGPSQVAALAASEKPFTKQNVGQAFKQGTVAGAAIGAAIPGAAALASKTGVGGLKIVRQAPRLMETPEVRQLQAQKQASIDAFHTATSPKVAQNHIANVNNLDKQIAAIKQGGFAKIPGGKPNRSSKQIETNPQEILPTKGTQPNLFQSNENAPASLKSPEVGTLKLAPQRSLEMSPSRSYQRTNRFIDTVINDPNTNPKVKQSISSLYSVRNTKDLQMKAATLVKEHPDVAEKLANNAADDTSVAVAQELIKSLQNKGEYTRAIGLVEKLSQDLTKAGQTVQAASIYGRLTPEGVLRFTQNEINKYNKLTGRKITLDPSRAEQLKQLADSVQKLPEGYDKQVATAKLVTEIQQTMPATSAEQLSSLQTMAQLLNPKTNIRNVGGNSIFSGLENISQTVATPVDTLLSLVTGKRTTALPSIGTQLKGGAEGLSKGIKEAKMGINTGPTTQFELNSVPVFRGKILGALEKTMNGTLRGADRAAYQAAFDDSIRASLKLAKTKQISPEMIEQAHLTGLYRTFQDTNAISKFFVGMKRSLNNLAGIGVEGKRFGLGDLVLKYPKTPANLLARGIDYSPAGFVKAMITATKPLAKQEFNQKQFVDEFSRAVVGSSVAFMGGYALAKNGIITAQPSQNKDLRNVQKTEGLGGYQINASALKRWVMSGFNHSAAQLRPGDTLVSYDWAQPIAVPISAGAAAGTEKPVKAGKQVTGSFAEGVNTLAEQPLLQGVQRLFNSNTSLPQNAVTTLQSGPASFVPTAVSQINQLFDNTSRNSGQSKQGVPGFFEGAANQAKAKIPGLAQTLPASVDVLGHTKQRYQDNTNNPFNVFVNPAFVNKYTPNTTAQTSLDLYSKTGETKQLPNTVKPTIIVNGKPTDLTPEQQGNYQRYVGQINNTITSALSSNNTFNSLEDTQKVNILSSLQTDINAAAKTQLFGDSSKLSKYARMILNGDLGGAIEAKLNQSSGIKTSKSKKMRVGRSKKSGGRKSRGVKLAGATIGSNNGPKANVIKASSKAPAPSGKLAVPKGIRVARAKKAKIGGGKIRKIAV